MKLSERLGYELVFKRGQIFCNFDRGGARATSKPKNRDKQKPFKPIERMTKNESLAKKIFFQLKNFLRRFMMKKIFLL